MLSPHNRKNVYIFKFKFNKDAKTAISQIVDRHYYEKFMGEGLPIKLIGVNVNVLKGQINAWSETTMKK